MADANESDSNLEKAWHLKYLRKVFKDVRDSNTGEIAQVAYCECVLPKSNTDSTPCKAAYIFIPKHGLGNNIQHLLNIHGIVIAPVLSFSAGKVLNTESLKTECARHIVLQNLPFVHFESQSFLDIVGLLNPAAVKMMVKADAMADHVIKMCVTVKEHVRNTMCDPGVPVINFTCDVWTSPKNFGIFAVTGHWIDKECDLNDVVIWVTEIDGKHSGENLACYLMEIITAYGIGDKLCCITADNASSNRTLARALQNALPKFNATEKMLGCIGHIVNLAAKAGVKVLGYIVPSEPSLTLIDDEVDDLDQNAFSSNPGSVVTLFRDVSIWIRSSPQRTQSFVRHEKLANVEPNDLKVILDVETRWNSSYNMLVRIKRLRVPVA